MAQISMTPTSTDQIAAALRRVEEATKPPEEPMPVSDPPEAVAYELAAGLLPMDPGAKWSRAFEVRELTGRDEEQLAKTKDAPRMLIAMLLLGLVEVGGEKVSNDVLDRMFGGDWDTALLAIRIATFGPTYETSLVCQECRSDCSLSIDLRSDIPTRRIEQDDAYYQVVGRHGTVYEVGPLFGYTQRIIMTGYDEYSLSEMNTKVLEGIVRTIDGKPSLGRGSILNIPMADRRLLLKEADERRVGPDFGEVRMKCPTCDAEQPVPLSIVALFQE